MQVFEWLHSPHSATCWVGIRQTIFFLYIGSQRLALRKLCLAEGIPCAILAQFNIANLHFTPTGMLNSYGPLSLRKQGRTGGRGILEAGSLCERLMGVLPLPCIFSVLLCRMYNLQTSECLCSQALSRVPEACRDTLVTLNSLHSLCVHVQQPTQVRAH